MGSKLEQGMYKDRFDFQKDFRLMTANAKQYNMPGSFVHNEAISLEIFFEKRKELFNSINIQCLSVSTEWSIISKTLDQHAINVAEEAEAAAPKPPPKPPRILPPVPEARFSPPPPSQAQPSRPTIRLKMPSQSTSAAPDAKATAGSSKPRKPKPKRAETALVPPLEDLAALEPDVDAPPPPYIDDGSHDLLQEVLAIEREKDEEKRQRGLLKAPERVVNGSSSKRKQPESTAEDEILALATPAKKEKPNPAATSTSTSSNGKLVLPAIKLPKPKKDISAPPHNGGSSSRSTSARSTPAIEVSRPSLKGKEREVTRPPTPTTTAPPTKTKKQATVQAIPINEKKCKDILKVLAKIPDSAIFQIPVDPVRDGCPTCVFYPIALLWYLEVFAGTLTKSNIPWISARFQQSLGMESTALWKLSVKT